MTFDHLPQHERYFDIASAPKYPYWAIFLELKKCEVVCRTCHDVRETSRLKTSREVADVFLILQTLAGESIKLKDGLTHKTRRRRKLMESYRAYRETVPAQVRMRAEAYPPVSISEKPKTARFITTDYIEATEIADKIATQDNFLCQVIEYDLQFYVVAGASQPAGP